MRIEAEIQAVRTSKKGDTLTIFIAKEHRAAVVEHIMAFIEKPVTLELLIDAKKVIENADRISEEQRKKAYAIFKDYGKEYGDTPENVKAMLKSEYERLTGSQISLSDCSRDTATEFIEFVLSNARSLGYKFAFNEQSKELGAILQARQCFVCRESGNVYGNDKGKLCLCDKHAAEVKEIGTKEFIEKYHIELV